MLSYTPGIDFPKTHAAAGELIPFGDQAISVIRQKWSDLRNRFAESELQGWVNIITDAIHLMEHAQIEPGERRRDLGARFIICGRQLAQILRMLFDARGSVDVHDSFNAVKAFIVAFDDFESRVMSWVEADPEAFGSSEMEQHGEAKAPAEHLNPAQGSPAAGENTPVALNQMERNIIEALDKKRMTGEALAKPAGYTFNSAFKATLASLVRRGILSNKNDSQGRGYELARPLS